MQCIQSFISLLKSLGDSLSLDSIFVGSDTVLAVKFWCCMYNPAVRFYKEHTVTYLAFIFQILL